MRKNILTIILLTTCLYVQSQESNNGNEPKANFEVTINGKVYSIGENQDLKLDSLPSKATLSVKMANYKKFDNSSISFEFPQYFAFEFDQDFGYKNWTLTGNSLILMVFEIDAKTTLQSLMDESIKKFGRKNCTLEDFEKIVGDKKLNGKKLMVKLAGQALSIEGFEINLNDFKSRFIYFQDSLDKEGNHSEEYEKGFKMIDSTIVFK